VRALYGVHLICITHPSPSSSESTPSTLYLHSLFCANPFVLALVLLQFLLRVYARTISHPFACYRGIGR